jgi:hypothetical protein
MSDVFRKGEIMQKSIKCEFMMGALTNQETYRIGDLLYRILYFYHTKIIET